MGDKGHLEDAIRPVRRSFLSNLNDELEEVNLKKEVVFKSYVSLHSSSLFSHDYVRLIAVTETQFLVYETTSNVLMEKIPTSCIKEMRTLYHEEAVMLIVNMDKPQDTVTGSRKKKRKLVIDFMDVKKAGDFAFAISRVSTIAAPPFNQSKPGTQKRRPSLNNDTDVKRIEPNSTSGRRLSKREQNTAIRLKDISDEMVEVESKGGEKKSVIHTKTKQNKNLDIELPPQVKRRRNSWDSPAPERLDIPQEIKDITFERHTGANRLSSSHNKKQPKPLPLDLKKSSTGSSSTTTTNESDSQPVLLKKEKEKKKRKDPSLRVREERIFISTLLDQQSVHIHKQFGIYSSSLMITVAPTEDVDVTINKNRNDLQMQLVDKVKNGKQNKTVPQEANALLGANESITFAGNYVIIILYATLCCVSHT